MTWRQSTLALGALFAFGLCAGAALLAVRAFRAEWRDFHPRRGPVPLPAPPLAGLSAVSFPSADGTALKGWLVPSRNGAAVLLAHGTDADRRALLPEARLLVSHGYGALLLDLPGHGESDGPVHWSEESRAALRAAARFLAAQPGIQPGKVAAYGFSMGAHALAQLSAEDLPLAALILAGAPTDGDELTAEQQGRFGPLTQWPALWADRLCGFVAAPTPLSAVQSSRLPLLIIWGGRDVVVPPRMSLLLSQSGPGPREVLVLPRAGHGDYLQADEAAWAGAVLGFLSRWLAP